MTDVQDAALISETRAIRAVGCLSGTAPLDLVSNQVSSVLDDSEIVLVVVPASAHPAIAETIARHLKGDETIVLTPGRTAGVVCFRNCLQRVRAMPNITVGETESLIFTCRKIKAGLVDLMKFKDFGQCAFLGPNRKGGEGFMRAAFPQVQVEDSTLSTGLANVGAILHPALVLLNTGRVEDPRASFLHHYHGITPTVAKFLEKIDLERVRLARIFGIEVSSALRWHEQCYGLRGENLFDTLRVNERYASLKAPESLDHRYLYEEIPTGLVPMISLANAVGLAVPCMQSVLDLAGLLLEKEYMQFGRNAQLIGIKEGDSIDGIRGLF